MMVVMRYPKHHKNEIKDRIVRAAASILRERGLELPSVPDLMKGAGLTHGGFYGYFSGRDELAAAAVTLAAEQTAAGVFESHSNLESVLRAYLSEQHVRHPESGCVVAALGTEGWRSSKQVRAAFAHIAGGLAKLVDRKIRRRSDNDVISERALALTAQMIGTVILGRLLADPDLVRRTLHAGLGAALRI